MSVTKTGSALDAALAKMPQIAARVATAVAPQFSELAAQAFDGRRSPYGTPWAGNVTLNQSGRLRSAALAFRASGSKIRSTVASVPYARYHIWRGILPRGGAALPPNWDAAIRAEAAKEFRAVVQGSRA